MTEPACNCPKPNGAHDEKCAHIKHVRSDNCVDDLKIPEFLRRPKPLPQGGVFD